MRSPLPFLSALAPAALALALALSTAPALAAPIHLCERAAVVMPSPETHRAWLEKDVRYGPDDAAAFADRVKRFGPGVLNTQIVVADEVGASAWFDIEGYSGLREAKIRMIRKRDCDTDPYYPLVVLVGLKARSISRNALFVAKSRGTYEVIALKPRAKGKTFALRLAGSGEIVCRDFRACDGIAAHPRLRR